MSDKVEWDFDVITLFTFFLFLFVCFSVFLT